MKVDRLDCGSYVWSDTLEDADAYLLEALRTGKRFRVVFPDGLEGVGGTLAVRATQFTAKAGELEANEVIVRAYGVEVEIGGAKAFVALEDLEFTELPTTEG